MCTRFSCVRSIFLVVLFGVASMPAFGTVVQFALGLSSIGNPVSFKAELTIASDMLTVQLFNLSPQQSKAPNDLLCSYFFDIINSTNNRPPLAYVSDFRLGATVHGHRQKHVLPDNPAR
jgi:hypothetical protein